MPCNQVCEQEKYRFVRNAQESFYANGGSRCNGRCQAWVKYDGLFCPCCSVRLRKHPRSKNGYQYTAKLDSTRIS